MRGKSILALGMAVGSGLVAMVGVQQALQKDRGVQDTGKVTVFVAASEINPGQTIDLNMLEKKRYPLELVPKNAVTDPKQLDKRALMVKAMPGDVIRLDKLGEPGQTGASISIPPGFRVLTVPTNTTQAHSGMIQPGDRVDVMVTYKVPAGQGGREVPETRTILGFIQVFATDAQRDPGATADAKASAAKNISLLVTPQQAQTLMMAQTVGAIQLSLRNSTDSKEVEVTSLTPEEFRNSVLSSGVKIKEDQDQANLEEAGLAESGGELNQFLSDATTPAQPVVTAQVAAVAPPSNVETWEIHFLGKEGARIETVEIAKKSAGEEKQAAKQQGEGSIPPSDGATVQTLDSRSAQPSSNTVSQTSEKPTLSNNQGPAGTETKSQSNTNAVSRSTPATDSTEEEPIDSADFELQSKLQETLNSLQSKGNAKSLPAQSEKPKSSTTEKTNADSGAEEIPPSAQDAISQLQSLDLESKLSQLSGGEKGDISGLESLVPTFENPTEEKTKNHEPQSPPTPAAHPGRTTKPAARKPSTVPTTKPTPGTKSSSSKSGLASAKPVKPASQTAGAIENRIPPSPAKQPVGTESKGVRPVRPAPNRSPSNPANSQTNVKLTTTK